MNFCLAEIDNEAENIIQKIRSGKLIEGCSMSAIQTPTIEAWEVAQELASKSTLSSKDKQDIYSKLPKEVRLQLAATKYDSFDLIYERLLQLINLIIKG